MCIEYFADANALLRISQNIRSAAEIRNRRMLKNVETDSVCLLISLISLRSKISIKSKQNFAKNKNHTRTMALRVFSGME